MEPPALAAGPAAPVRAAPGASADLVLPPPTGSKPFTYHWSRAGASLDDRFSTSEDVNGVRLTVSSAQTGDSGVYTLQARNAAGSDTSKIRLEVSPEEAPTGEDPPTFLRRLQDLTVKVGSRTRFLVEIISSTECKVTWYRNERRLLEAERVALARDGSFWCADVAAVSVDDTGRWTCTAENAGGRASCSAHLNVLVPKAYKRPEFVEELRALLTEQGTVSLECKVVGVPTPVLRWFKDSREIKAGDVFALTANAEDPTSLGTYTCEAVNCMGRAYSSSKVHVVGRASREGSARPGSSGMTPEPPPIFTKELEDAHVKVCEHLTLGCHIVVPPWPRSVVWYNKEGKVEPGERYHMLEDGVGGYLLEMPSAEWADEGEWKCVATSAGGRVGISTCHVTMDVPKNYRKPRFMENLQAVLTEEGLVSFECKVVGFPTPVLSWFKDGQELKPGDVYQLTGTNSLGSYCCIARNCMGKASSSAELTVEDIQNQLNEEEKLQLFSKNQAPKFLQGLKSVEAKIDEPFRFTVKVAIPPEPSVLWYRDDQPVDESTRCHLEREDKSIFNLDIQNLEFLDQAEWKCVAMNDYGHSVTSCFLKLIIPRHYKKPRFLENLQAILSDEGAVNLECKVIGVPQPVLKWYKDGEELKPGDIHRIISGQDGTCCLGTYTCEAQNCMGIAASSASLLGFDDSMKSKTKKIEEQPLQRNLSLSTIHEERTSQMYDTPVGDITLDDKGEISFSFDGKEVSVSLYETPDLTEEEALQIVEMYADQLSENVTEHNVVELPPLRFVKETSTSGNLLMEAIIIDVSPDYFAAPEEDLRTEADVEDLSIADEMGVPQLSLDQDIEIGGEDYLEKTMALLSEEKSDFAAKSSRKKSDSQRSVDDFFSLSRDQSLSEEKHDDDTHVSESELQSFASAKSSAKIKSKSSKPSGEEGLESSEPTKTILFKEEIELKSTKQEDEELEVPITKPKIERRSSRGSRKSSTSSEKSISKSREELLRLKIDIEPPRKTPLNDDELKNTMNNIGTSLTKVINDIQLIERDIILKSELMSSAATASRSLEIISSLITPLSEINSIADAAKESVSESRDVTSTIFNRLPTPLKALQQSLTIIEKCIDMESDSKTLVKKTCVAFIETCGAEVQKVISDITSVISQGNLLTEDKVVCEVDSVVNEIITMVKFSAETIKTRNLLTEASEIKSEEPTLESAHIQDTQKAVFELKSPLNSLLRIVESAESGMITKANINNSEVIMNDMSASIQDLQTALEQIESLSVKESSTLLPKYNTEVIETVMDSVLKLRGSFELLSTEPKIEEDEAMLDQTLLSLKQNLTDISLKIEAVDKNVGQFDVLHSENKLEILQKMAQILIALENYLPRLEIMPEVKSNMDTFHKNLTKILENVIESNEAKKYISMMEICNMVNIINSSIKNLDSENVLPLASISNTFKIIQNHFVKNIFDSELNCSIMNNISDVLVGIEEAMNKAEEMSQQIDSEYIEEFSNQVIDESKVNIILTQIDQTIAAVNTIKTMESAQELTLVLTPALKSICPILEELKRSVASIRTSGVEQDAHISEISEAAFVHAIATPLCELNQNIIVLNEMIVENIDFIKENTEIITAIAEPLHELHTTLEILQQDVISQYGDDLTPYEVSVNMASVVQNLQSCIVMIQEQAGIEGADEMSTLEDISGIKTTADTLPSDRLVLPTAEETTVEQSLPPFFTQEIASTATAQTLQTLNEHIMVLQTPDVIEALDTLSEVSDYSSLKSIVVGLGDLHSGLEGILHPVPIEGSIDLEEMANISKLAAIAEPMQEIQQSLSVLDTSNIPIYENILDLPTEKIHSVFQSISEFKNSLEKCMCAVLPAIEITNNTIEISNKVSTLREVCEQLKEIFKDEPSNITLPPEIQNLEIVVDNLIDATDVTKDIQIDQVKCITEDLYLKVMEVQEDIIQFTALSPEKISQEAKLIQIVNDVETSIAVLEQYDFVDLSRASDLSTICASPQMAIHIDSDSLDQIHDIADNAVNILHDSYQDIPIADLMIVEDFFKTCKNEFTILRCLISKATSHKKIIRLLQEFNSLQTMVNSFTTKRLELHLSDDVNEYLTNFLIHADECLRNSRTSLIKVIDSQSDILIKTPLAQIESINELKQVKESKTNTTISNVVKSLQVVTESSQALENNLQFSIIEELSHPNKIPKPTQEEIILINQIETLSMIVDDECKALDLDDCTKKVLERLTSCINKHHDYKDAMGTGKTLIILKCLAESANIVREEITENKVCKYEATELKGKESSLKEVLAEMLLPLQALQTQIINIREQVLSGAEEDSISIDITTTESIMQTMNELHKDIVQQLELDKSTVDNEDISMIMEVDKEIHTIQDSIKSMKNVQAAQAVKEITKPMEDIEKSLHSVVFSEKTTLEEETRPKESTAQLSQNIDQYIELIEIVEEISAVIKIEKIKETFDIARKLKENISGSENISPGEQAQLCHKLQTGLSALQVLVSDSAQELATELGADTLQRIVQVTAQLQANLVAVAGVQIAVQAPILLAEEIKPEETAVKHYVSATESAVADKRETIMLDQDYANDKDTLGIQIEGANIVLDKTTSISTVTEVPEVENLQQKSSDNLVGKVLDYSQDEAEVATAKTFNIEEVEKGDSLQKCSNDKIDGLELTFTKERTSETIVMKEVESHKLETPQLSEEKNEEAYASWQESLMQHINEYVSEDIIEVVNELSSKINTKEFTQSVSIAKELRESIAATESGTKIETVNEIKDLREQQVELIQGLQTALSVLDDHTLEYLHELAPSIDIDTIKKIVTIKQNLNTVLAIARVFQQEILQTAKKKQQEGALNFETAQLAKDTDIETDKSMLLLEETPDIKIAKPSNENGNQLTAIEPTPEKTIPSEMFSQKSFESPEVSIEPTIDIGVLEKKESFSTEQLSKLAETSKELTAEHTATLIEKQTEDVLQSITHEDDAHILDQASVIGNIEITEQETSIEKTNDNIVSQLFDSQSKIDKATEEKNDKNPSVFTEQIPAKEISIEAYDITEEKNIPVAISDTLSADEIQIDTNMTEKNAIFATETETISQQTDSVTTPLSIISDKEMEQMAHVSQRTIAKAKEVTETLIHNINEFLFNDFLHTTNEKPDDNGNDIEQALKLANGLLDHLQTHTFDITELKNEPFCFKPDLEQELLAEQLQQALSCLQGQLKNYNTETISSLVNTEQNLLNTVTQLADILAKSLSPEIQITKQDIEDKNQSKITNEDISISHENKVIEKALTCTNKDGKAIETNLRSFEATDEFMDCSGEPSDNYKNFSSQLSSSVQNNCETILTETTKPFEEFFDSPTSADNIITSHELVATEILEAIILEDTKSVQKDDEGSKLDTLATNGSFASALTLNDATKIIKDKLLMNEEVVVSPEIKTHVLELDLSSEVNTGETVVMQESTKQERAPQVVVTEATKIDNNMGLSNVTVSICSNIDNSLSNNTSEVIIAETTSPQDNMKQKTNVVCQDLEPLSPQEILNIDIKTAMTEQASLLDENPENIILEPTKLFEHPVYEECSDELVVDEVLVESGLKHIKNIELEDGDLKTIISNTSDNLPSITSNELEASNIKAIVIDAETVLPEVKEPLNGISKIIEVNVIETLTGWGNEIQEKIEECHVEDNELGITSLESLALSTVKKSTETEKQFDLTPSTNKLPTMELVQANEVAEVFNLEPNKTVELKGKETKTDVVLAEGKNFATAITKVINDLENSQYDNFNSTFENVDFNNSGLKKPLTEVVICIEVPALETATEWENVTPVTPKQNSICYDDNSDAANHSEVSHTLEISNNVLSETNKALDTPTSVELLTSKEADLSTLEHSKNVVREDEIANTAVLKISDKIIPITDEVSENESFARSAIEMVTLCPFVENPLKEVSIISKDNANSEEENEIQGEKNDIQDEKNDIQDDKNDIQDDKNDIQVEMIIAYDPSIAIPQTKMESTPVTIETLSNTSVMTTSQASNKADISTEDNRRSNLIQHIDEFLTGEMIEIVNEIANITNTDALKESATVAMKLRESLMITDYSASAEKLSPKNENDILEQAVFAQALHDALLILHTQVLESAQIIAPIVSANTIEKLSEIISHLQEDLSSAIISDKAEIIEVVKAGEVEEEPNSMAQLKTLLQEVNTKINLTSAERAADTEDSESLKDTLDEVQTVIIKLKREYDSVANDTLNETLEDLECSVRSVQLQINEDSPPELLTEACATLQLLVNNMNATQQVQIPQTVLKAETIETILEKCSNETEETVKLLDVASKLDCKRSSDLSSIVNKLSTIRDTLKSLRESFLVDADTVIENGVKLVQCLDKIEENIFALEKDVDTAGNLATETRDSIITAVHSVYSSISNMRSTVSSVQKRYMFENYGKPSESILHSIKNVAVISKFDKDENKVCWKKLSKSLRKVLNHFEDIKFYINLDKTARLPSDAAFTKIILQELKENIICVLLPRAMLMDLIVLQQIHKLQKSIEKHLSTIESSSSLEVRNKIPMFKDIAAEVLTSMNSIKHVLEKTQEITEESSVNKEIQDKIEVKILKDDTVKELNGEDAEVTLAKQSSVSEIDIQTSSIKDTQSTVSEKDIQPSSIKDTLLTLAAEVPQNEEIIPFNDYIQGDISETTVKYVTEETISIPLEKQASLLEVRTESSISGTVEQMLGIVDPSDVQETLTTEQEFIKVSDLNKDVIPDTILETNAIDVLTLQPSTSDDMTRVAVVEEIRIKSTQTDEEAKLRESSAQGKTAENMLVEDNVEHYVSQTKEILRETEEKTKEAIVKLESESASNAEFKSTEDIYIKKGEELLPSEKDTEQQQKNEAVSQVTQEKKDSAKEEMQVKDIGQKKCSEKATNDKTDTENSLQNKGKTVMNKNEAEASMQTEKDIALLKPSQEETPKNKQDEPLQKVKEDTERKREEQKEENAAIITKETETSLQLQKDALTEKTQEETLKMKQDEQDLQYEKKEFAQKMKDQQDDTGNAELKNKEENERNKKETEQETVKITKEIITIIQEEKEKLLTKPTQDTLEETQEEKRIEKEGRKQKEKNLQKETEDNESQQIEQEEALVKQENVVLDIKIENERKQEQKEEEAANIKKDKEINLQKEKEMIEEDRKARLQKEKEEVELQLNAEVEARVQIEKDAAKVNIKLDEEEEREQKQTEYKKLKSVKDTEASIQRETGEISTIQAKEEALINNQVDKRLITEKRNMEEELLEKENENIERQPIEDEVRVKHEDAAQAELKLNEEIQREQKQKEEDLNIKKDNEESLIEQTKTEALRKNKEEKHHQKEKKDVQQKQKKEEALNNPEEDAAQEKVKEEKDRQEKQKEEEAAKIQKEKEEALIEQTKTEGLSKKKEAKRLQKEMEDVERQQKEEEARVKQEEDAALAKLKEENDHQEKQKEEEAAKIQKEKEEALIEETKTEALSKKKEAERLQKEKEDVERKQKEKEARVKQEEDAAQAKLKEENDRQEKQKEKEAAKIQKEKEDALIEQTKKEDLSKKKEVERLQKEKEDVERKQKEEEARLKQEEDAAQAKLKEEKDRQEKYKEEEAAKIQKEKEEALIEQTKKEALSKKKKAARLQKDKEDVERKQKEEEARVKQEEGAAQAKLKEEKDRQEKQKEEEAAKIQKEKEEALIEQTKTEGLSKKKEAEHLQKEKEVVERKQKEEEARVKQEEDAAQAKLKEKNDRQEKQKEEEAAKIQKEREEALIEETKTEALSKKKEAERLQKEKEDIERKQKEEEARVKQEEDAAQAKLKEEKDRREKQKEVEAEKIQQEREEALIEQTKTEGFSKKKEAERLQKEKEDVERKQKEEEARVKQEDDAAEAKLKEETDRQEKQKEEEAAKIQKEKEEAFIEQTKKEALSKKKKAARLQKEKEDVERKQKEEEARVKQEDAAQAKLKEEKDRREKQKEEEAEKIQQEREEALIEQTKKEALSKKKEVERLQKEKEDVERKQKEEEARLKQEEDAAQAKLKEEKDRQEKQKEEEAAKIQKEKEEALIEQTKSEGLSKMKEAEPLQKEKEDVERKQKEEEARVKQEEDAAQAKLKEEKDRQEKQKEEEAAKIQKEKEEALIEKTKKEALSKKKKAARLQKEKEDVERKQKEEEARVKQEEDAAQAKLKEEKDRREKQKEEEVKKIQQEREEALIEQTKKEALSKKKEVERLQKEKEDVERKQKEEEARVKQEEDAAQAKLKEEKDRQEKQKEEEAAKIQKEKEEALIKQTKKEDLSMKKEAERLQKEMEDVERQQKEEEARVKQEEDAAQAKLKEEKDRREKQKEEEAEKIQQEREEALIEQTKKEALSKKKEVERLQKEKKDVERKQKEEEARVKQEEDAAQSKLKEEKDRQEKQKEEEAAKIQKEKEEALIEQTKKEALSMKKKAARLQKEKEDVERKQKEEEARVKQEDEAAQAKLKVETDRQEKQNEEEAVKIQKEKEDAATAELNLKEEKELEQKIKKEEEVPSKNEDLRDKKVKIKKDRKTDNEFTKKKLKNNLEKLGTLEQNEAEKSNNEKETKLTKEINNDELNIEVEKLSTAKHDDKVPTKKNEFDEISKKATKYTERLDKNERRDDELHMYKNESDLHTKKENGDTSEHEVSREQHYIKEYQYEPTQLGNKLESREKLRFVDHNHRDYTMEFARPSGYREKSFDVDKNNSFSTHEMGRKAAIYKAQTIVQDAQLRSSAPSYPETNASRTSEPTERCSEIRSRSKALSEARSIISEKRTGLSRDSKRKPVFSTYLTDRTAVEGSRVKLTCSVLSSMDPTVTWYKNGVPLDNKLKYRTKFIDGLVTLEVLNAVPSDSAEYSCTITNENGSVNSSATLKVYPSFEASPIPPTFTRSIRDTYHLAENELVLECRIRGQPLPTITWLKDDKPVSSDSRYQAYYLADGVCRLAIEHPTPEDSGKYTCKAENSVWSDQITHIVSFTGKESRLSPNIATIEKSRFNRQAMESRRPHFTNVLSDYKVVQGGTIGLQVEIRGAPTRVEWLREGCSVTEVYRNAKTFVEQGLYTLALSDVTEKESGMYTCRAWSSQSHVDMNAAITVVQPNELDGKPAVIVGRPEKDILISVGEDVNISFRVQGEPRPKVVFMKGIRDITTNQRVCKMTSDDYMKFTLKRSVVSDAGTYCILARNAYGCDRAFVTVVVRQRASSDNLISDWTYPADDTNLAIADRKYKSVPERIPGVPSVVEGGNNWISLGWPKSEPGPSAPVLAYKVESWLLGKEGGARWVELGITPLTSFDAFNLKQGEQYHFRVTPRNRYGWGESVQTSTPIGVGLAGDRPEFTESLPGQLKILVGETANLSCSVKGKPAPEVVWMKNGHEIEDEDRRLSSSFNGFNCCLTIKDINIEDEARYSCEASNVHGRASTYARLAVVTDRSVWEADAKLKRERSADVEGDYPPQFTMRLRDRRVQATYPVRLTCQVIGSPDPIITWFKDGEEVKPDSRRSHFQDEHFHTLEIAPTTLEDGGVYEVMAQNSSGAVSCRCNLVVDKGIRAYVAPEFCCGLEPLYRLTDGEELRISAVVEAYPSVGVTWYRDGVRLRPSRRAIMTLDRDGQIELALAAVTSRDAGVYTCTASNEVGRASTSGKVEVTGTNVKRTPPVFISPDEPYSKEPMFIRKPRSSEAREGDTVIIACEVVGDPKPDVYWLRDFLKPDYYRDATHFKRMGDGPEYRFEIPHAKLDYTGAYSVVARNQHGEAKAVISLQILAKDPSSSDDSHNIRYGRVEVLPRFTKELTDLLSCDGDVVQFECRLSGHPEPYIKWFHYHELIRDSLDFETSFEEGTARLKIKQVTAEDEGTYTCEAANNLGKAKSSACLVVYPPGEPNTLSQRLRRPPAFLSAASTPRSTPRSTPARSVSRTPGPEIRRLCSPARTLAPSFYTYPFNKVAEEGDTVTLQCAIKGNPAPWATWDKDGVIITPSSRITIKEKDDVLRVLEIDQVTIDDVGVYRITIENEFGRQEASARIEVITQRGKFYAGVRAVSPSPRKSLTYRGRRPSTPKQD